MTCSLAACSGSTTTTSQNNADSAADDTASADNATTAADSAAGTDTATDAADSNVKEADLSDIIPDETVTLTVYSQLRTMKVSRSVGLLIS